MGYRKLQWRTEIYLILLNEGSEPKVRDIIQRETKQMILTGENRLADGRQINGSGIRINFCTLGHYMQMPLWHSGKAPLQHAKGLVQILHAPGRRFLLSHTSYADKSN